MWSGLYNYGKYGAKNPNTDILSAEQLKAINPADLTKIIAGVNSYKHRIFYYGQDDISKVKSVLKKYHIVPAELKDIPAPVKYAEKVIDKNIVYFVNYEMVQANVVMIAKKNKFKKEQLPAVKLFNEYFGAGMGSIVFQEIRESQALAYSAWSSFSTPSKKDNSNYILGSVSTQMNKLKLATDGLLKLLNDMPHDQKAFDNARTAIMKKIESERITKDNIYWTMDSNLDKGIDYDYRKGVYDLAKKATFKDIDKFFNENVKNSKYAFLVVGNRKLVDMKTLEKLGTVKELSLKDIFGYEN
jgi:predicted Zn-dependent peptidase